METQTIIDDAARMLRNGELEDCLRFTGEELARADNRWRRDHNAGESRENLVADIENVLVLSGLHAAVLRRANDAAQAFGTSIAALMSVAVEDVMEDVAYNVLGIVDGALADLQQAAVRMPDDETTSIHVPVIITYLSSIEYALYGLCSRRGGAFVEAAYATLSGLMGTGAIQSPMVETPSGMASPLHPLPILNDLIGRAVALGLVDGD